MAQFLTYLAVTSLDGTVANGEIEIARVLPKLLLDIFKGGSKEIKLKLQQHMFDKGYTHWLEQ
ncbi:MAG: hypothetical protein Q9M91_06655 [Candidatus Dojkabacteria bacterium]|nr:hypothetical protein [Candidatus Dojkabacteria bacterium]MDQ7021476.1 hypothetical protein [Candidatus Dojkabacteria bacterium]